LATIGIIAASCLLHELIEGAHANAKALGDRFAL
jgi:hypothetical protein